MSFDIPISKSLLELSTVYPSKDELRDSVKKWAEDNGFFVSSTSDKIKSLSTWWKIS
jgi:hypothetical protein